MVHAGEPYVLVADVRRHGGMEAWVGLWSLMELGLKKKVTPKAMRRTFQDLARAAEVKDIVTRAVSGHATASMQERRYSTVRGEEIHAGVGKVISLAGFKAAIAPTDEPSGVRSGVRAPKTQTELRQAA